MTCSKCECLVRVKNKLGYNLYYCGYKKYGALKALSGLYINNEEYRKNNKTCKYYKGVRKMTDEEKAEEYVNNAIKGYENDFTECEVFSMITCYKKGLAEGRKELEKENAGLKAEIKQIIERERVVPEHYLCEMIDKNKELKAQVESLASVLKEIADYSDCKASANMAKNELNKWELAEK